MKIYKPFLAFILYASFFPSNILLKIPLSLSPTFPFGYQGITYSLQYIMQNNSTLFLMDPSLFIYNISVSSNLYDKLRTACLSYINHQYSLLQVNLPTWIIEAIKDTPYSPEGVSFLDIKNNMSKIYWNTWTLFGKYHKHIK